MKKYALLYMLVAYYIVEYVFCHNILSKFYQNDYKVKDVRMQLINFDKDYYNFFEVKAFKYNRSTTAHNITWGFKKDVKDELEVIVQVYKFLSNEYRDFAVRFQVNLQKSFRANVIGLRDATKCGNITNFLFHQDIIYHTCNFVIDESRLPPLIPDGKYRVEIIYVYLNRQISVMYIFGEVYRPIPIYPKKKNI